MSVYIIAEIGINHNGDINIAKKLIDLAFEAGVNAVKFQKRDIDVVYEKNFLSEKRLSPWGKTQYDQKKGLEFGNDEYDEIDKYCASKKIDWFASAWDINSLNFLKKYETKYNKIASALIVDLDLLEEVAKEKKYTFISTGMCEWKHIDKAVEIFKKHKCDFELMHCISAYPFDGHLANLNLMLELKKRYGCKVGYSGHEKNGLAISYAAVALGASSLERHITLDRLMYGSDQAASLTPLGFKQLVGGVRVIEKSINGFSQKKILDIEIEIAKKLRAHIKIN
jgi:N-acetylneuraminate synthase